MSETSKSLISIIVPVKDEEQHIGKCVDSLLAQTYPKTEIIIINDGSQDSTWKILKKYGNKIKVIERSGIGPSKARNEAIGLAKGDYIAFTDGDCIAENNWLEELMAGFDEKTVAVGGIQRMPKDSERFSIGVHSFFSTFGFVSDYFHRGKKIKEVQHNPTCNVMYKKEVFDLAGKFREDLWPCEDLEFDIRLRKMNLTLKLNPAAVVYHYRPERFIDFTRMMYKYGEAHANLNNIHGFIQKIHFMPLVVFLVILAGIILNGINKEMFYSVFTILLSAYLGLVFLKNGNFRRSIWVSWLLVVAILCWTYGFFINSQPDFRKTI